MKHIFKYRALGFSQKLPPVAKLLYVLFFHWPLVWLGVYNGTVEFEIHVLYKSRLYISCCPPVPHSVQTGAHGTSEMGQIEGQTSFLEEDGVSER